METHNYEPTLYIKTARHIKDYLLEVEFTNDCKKIVDLYEIVERCKPMQVYLKEKAGFANFKVKQGVIVWGNDIDIAPESIYLAGDWKFLSKGKNFKEPSYFGINV